MFNTLLSIEEEILLDQILDGEHLDRAAALHRINALAFNSEGENLEIAKSLFLKIKETSDYEYNSYIEIMLKKDL